MMVPRMMLACLAIVASCSTLHAADSPVEDELTPAEVALQQHYHQPYRPQFHFTALQGHIGDATGLIYYSGEYHLFHMFDKWGHAKRDRHKCWGHAISRDLLCWEEQPPILDALVDNKPGSGSGVVDWNNSSGLRSGPYKTLVVFYTDYHTGSCIAYSNDRGRTWVRHVSNPVLPGTKDIRDPTVFWYAPAAQWRMVRYEEQGFAFYASENLVDWTYLSRVEGFYECPDFIELPVENSPGERHWVLIDASTAYVIGSFDGRQFRPETEKLRVEQGKTLYATQTWKKTPEGGAPAVQMGWLRYPKDRRLTWFSQMSFPCELTLRKSPEGVRLCRLPIAEIKNLRIAQQTWRDLTVRPGENPLAAVEGDLLEIHAEIELGTASGFSFVVRGQAISYSATEERVEFAGTKTIWKPSEKRIQLQILLDRSSIELFLGRGEVSISKTVFPDPADMGLNLLAEGGELHVAAMEVHRLESIWLEAETRLGRSPAAGTNPWIGR
jgi:fructan beta-fructosidase